MTWVRIQDLDPHPHQNYMDPWILSIGKSIFTWMRSSYFHKRSRWNISNNGDLWHL